MLSVQKAQTGKRVYGGFSQSPNRGQVSAKGAQGYIQRELRNKRQAGVQRRIGSDGKSDNRSSIAAQALNRMQGGNFFIGGTHNHGNPNSGIKPPNAGKGGRPTTNKGPFGGKNTGINPNAGKNRHGGQTGNQKPGQQGNKPPKGPFGEYTNGVPNQQPQSVQVSEDGILQLPYNQDFSVGQLSAINDANSQLLDLKQQGDDQALQYGQGMRDAGLNYQQLAAQSLNQNAAGGTAFSSQYGTAVANNARDYSNTVSGLQQANTNFLNNQSLQRSTIQSSLNQQLAALAQQYANDLNDQAGSLGYGRTRGNTSHTNRKATHKMVKVQHKKDKKR